LQPIEGGGATDGGASGHDSSGADEEDGGSCLDGEACGCGEGDDVALQLHALATTMPFSSARVAPPCAFCRHGKCIHLTGSEVSGAGRRRKFFIIQAARKEIW